MTDTCRICKLEKPRDAFPREGTKARTRKECRACRADTKRAWNRANREKYLAAKRRDQLKSLYGITQADVNTLLNAQHGRCGICGIDTPGGRGSWHVDHDHDTGRVRGLLCWQCNRRLGERERTAWQDLATKYLAGPT